MFGTIRVGEVRIGPFMLLLGVAVHLLLPVALLYWAWRLNEWWQLPPGIPAWIGVPAGAAILILSVWLEGRAMRPFFQVGGSPSPLQPTWSLVVSGPYRYCRHPIYLAYIGYVVGPGLALGWPATLLVGAVLGAALAVFAWVYEEPCLRKRFGEPYDEYRKTTPFMIPRFW